MMNLREEIVAQLISSKVYETDYVTLSELKELNLWFDITLNAEDYDEYKLYIDIVTKEPYFELQGRDVDDPSHYEVVFEDSLEEFKGNEFVDFLYSVDLCRRTVVAQ